jgi:hypothetical protein
MIIGILCLNDYYPTRKGMVTATCHGNIRAVFQRKELLNLTALDSPGIAMMNIGIPCLNDYYLTRKRMETAMCPQRYEKDPRLGEWVVKQRQKIRKKLAN